MYIKTMRLSLCQLSEVKLTVEIESACLSEEMTDINARLSCTTSEESNSPSQVLSLFVQI